MNKYSKYFIVAGIIVLTIIIYAKSIHNGFLHWDDNIGIVNNNDIKTLTTNNIRKIFTNYYIGMYQPLTTLSFALEYRFFALNPLPYHVDNLLIHLLNVILVFFFIYSLTKKLNISTIVTLFFGIHPMHVESVAWISERKDVLYSFFFLAGLITYIYYLKKQKHKYLVYTLILFILSLLSKSAAICFPLVLVLIDYYINYDSDPSKNHSKPAKNFRYLVLRIRYWVNKLPFFIIAIIFGIVSIYSQKSNGSINALSLFSIFDRIFLVFYSVAFYIVKLFIPAGLCAMHIYPVKPSGMLPIEYYLSAIFIIGIVLSILLIKSEQLKKDLIFGSLFYLITIVLVLQIIPLGDSIAAERYTYIPYIGLLFIIGSIYNNILNSKLLIAYRLSLIAFCVIFSVSTYQRNKVWKDDMTLFTDVIQKQPDASIAYSNRGMAEATSGNFKGALENFNKAIALLPEYAMAYYNRGWAKDNTGDLKGAMEDYNKAIALKPDYGDAYNNRGVVYNALQKYDKAVQDYTKAIELRPNLLDAYLYRAMSYAEMKNYNKAINDYQKFISFKSNDINGYLNMAELFVITDKYDKALQALNSSKSIIITNGPMSISLFLEIIAKIMLNKDYAANIEKFNKILKTDFKLGWDFNMTDEWVNKTNMTDNKRNLIKTMTENLKKHY